MRKRKLTLKRETVRKISDKNVKRAAGAEVSIQSGETYCWCTDCGCGEIDFDRAF